MLISLVYLLHSSLRVTDVYKKKRILTPKAKEDSHQDQLLLAIADVLYGTLANVVQEK